MKTKEQRKQALLCKIAINAQRLKDESITEDSLAEGCDRDITAVFTAVGEEAKVKEKLASEIKPSCSLLATLLNAKVTGTFWMFFSLKENHLILSYIPSFMLLLLLEEAELDWQYILNLEYFKMVVFDSFKKYLKDNNLTLDDLTNIELN